MVVSALGGITDLLIKAAELAASRDAGYSDIAREVEKRHIETIKKLIPVTKQSGILSKVKAEFF